MSDPVLKQLARRGSARGPVEMTVSRALHIALPRAAEQAVRMALCVNGIDTTRETRESLVAALDDGGLMALIGGPDGVSGLVAIDAGLCAALIEVQTTGRVVHAAPEQRRATRTDLSMCEGFVNLLFDLVTALLIEKGRGVWPQACRVGAQIDNPRKLALKLEGDRYSVHRIAVDLGDAAKQGELLLALCEDIPTAAAGDDTADMVQWRHSMQGAVYGSEALLVAVLHRVGLPLSAVRSLAVGQTVPIPIQALQAMTIEAPDGTRLAAGRLGQSQGFRAVKICGADPPAVSAGDKWGEGGAPAPPPDMPPPPGMIGQVPDAGPTDAGADAPPPGTMTDRNADMGGAAMETGIETPGSAPAFPPDMMPDGPNMPDMTDTMPTQPADLPDLPDMAELPPLPLPADLQSDGD